MAQWGSVVTQRADVQAIGTDQLLPVMRVTGRTSPHGVIFDVLVLRDQYNADQIGVTIGAMAEGIESMFGLGGVIGAEYVEDLNDAGLIEFFLDVTVEVPPPNPNFQGPQTTVVRVPLFAFGEASLRGPLINEPIEAAKAHLATWASA